MAEHWQVACGGPADQPHLLRQPGVAIVDAHGAAEEHQSGCVVEALRYRLAAVDRDHFPGDSVGIEVVGDVPGLDPVLVAKEPDGPQRSLAMPRTSASRAVVPARTRSFGGRTRTSDRPCSGPPAGGAATSGI